MIRHNLVKNPIISEKSTGLAQYAVPQYSFLVDKKATKGEIKAFLKTVLAVDAVNVRTMVASGKSKRVLGKSGRKSRTASYKKAVVTLKSGQKLDLYEK